MSKLKTTLGKNLFEQMWKYASKEDKIEYESAQILLVDMNDYDKDGNVVKEKGSVCYIRELGDNVKTTARLAKGGGVARGGETEIFVRRAGIKDDVFNINSREVNSAEFRKRIVEAAKNAAKVIEIERNDMQNSEKGEIEMEGNENQIVNLNETEDETFEENETAQENKENLEEMSLTEENLEEIPDETVENVETEESVENSERQQVLTKIVENLKKVAEMKKEDVKTEDNSSNEDETKVEEPLTEEIFDLIENSNHTGYFSPIIEYKKEGSSEIVESPKMIVVDGKEYPLFKSFENEKDEAGKLVYRAGKNKFVAVENSESLNLKDSMFFKKVLEGDSYTYEVVSVDPVENTEIMKNVEETVETPEVVSTEETVEKVSDIAIYDGKLEIKKDYFGEKYRTVANDEYSEGLVFVAKGADLKHEDKPSVYFLNLENVNDAVKAESKEIFGDSKLSSLKKHVIEKLKACKTVKDLTDLGAVVVKNGVVLSEIVGEKNQAAKTFNLLNYNSHEVDGEFVVNKKATKVLDEKKNLKKWLNENYDQKVVDYPVAKTKVKQALKTVVAFTAGAVAGVLGFATFFGTGFAENDRSAEAKDFAKEQTTNIVNEYVQSENENQTMPANFKFVAEGEAVVESQKTLLKYGHDEAGNKIVTGVGGLYEILKGDVDVLQHSGLGYLRGYNYTNPTLEGNAESLGEAVFNEMVSNGVLPRNSEGEFNVIYPQNVGITTSKEDSRKWIQENLGKTEEQSMVWADAYENAMQASYEVALTSGKLDGILGEEVKDIEQVVISSLNNETSKEKIGETLSKKFKTLLNVVEVFTSESDFYFQTEKGSNGNVEMYKVSRPEELKSLEDVCAQIEKSAVGRKLNLIDVIADDIAPETVEAKYGDAKYVFVDSVKNSEAVDLLYVNNDGSFKETTVSIKAKTESANDFADRALVAFWFEATGKVLNGYSINTQNSSSRPIEIEGRERA